MKKLQLAIVTGGSSGIGFETCCRLIQEGYYVINADIRPPQEEHRHNYQYVPCDVTQGEQVQELSFHVQQKGTPEVLILNAGRGIHEKLREGDPDKWAEIIDINLCGTLRVLRAILPFMQKGRIIFISSVSSSHPHPYGGIYAATKSALDTIAETLRLEELPHIGVTIISPGVVNTSFFENMVSGTHSVESIGWGAIEPAEIAEAVSYVLKQKDNTNVNNIILRPSGQAL